MYLSNNTRPDIAFAVNQVARFSNNPRLCHEVAVKRIAKYLKHTLFKDPDGSERVHGMIFKPDKAKQLALNLHCDADFGGLFNAEENSDPNSARSRTGYICTLGDLPVIWSSKLQVEICLSTAESEMAALCSGMRALVPCRFLLFEIAKCFNIPIKRLSTISHVYEDNNACISVATANPPRLTPRNKHWCIKYNWFKTHLGEDTILIQHVNSENQIADCLTKPLTQALFEKFRKLLLGW